MVYGLGWRVADIEGSDFRVLRSRIGMHTSKDFISVVVALGVKSKVSLANIYVSLVNICVSWVNICVSWVNIYVSWVNICVSWVNIYVS
jgi:hypothetical protein